ncbi:ABC transporter permease [candidate division KSB1 bacterium]|nr:ABC transporter permease [candidate division KSB1 bacterium]
MLKNYFKIALRNLWKEKLYASINIIGLAIGIACCILIAAGVLRELSYDDFHANGDTIFRLVLAEKQASGETSRNTLFPATLPPAIAKEFAGVKHASGYIGVQSRIVHEGESFSGRQAEVNPAFLSMFTFPLAAGDVATALNEPNDMVLTKTFAQKIFGVREGSYSEVVGKIVSLAGQEDFKITGVLEDVPRNLSLNFDFLIPLGDGPKFGGNSNWAGFTTVYLQLHEAEAAAELVKLLPPFVERQLGEKFRNDEELTSLGSFNEVITPQLQPLRDIYLNDEIRSNYNQTGSAVTLYSMSAIAVLILAIACFNFVTLSVGRSSGRATEVGIRKVLGAQRSQVAVQFWGETILLSLFALVLGMALAEMILPAFRMMLGMDDYAVSYTQSWGMPLSIFLIVVVTGVIAGAYPSVVLSRFQPVNVLKGRLGLAGRGRLTRWLVVLQNGLCVVLLIVTGVMSQQLTYFQNKDLGFDKEQVLVVSAFGETNSERYKQKLTQLAGVISAGASDRSFTSGWQTAGVKDKKGEWITVRFIRIDPDYLATLHLDLIAGRNFSYDRPVDVKESVIVNETLVKAFGWEDPIGKQLPDLQTDTSKAAPAIIGVVKDFHIDRLHRELQPLVLHMNPDRHGIYSLFVRLQPGEIPETLRRMEAAWRENTPEYPFNYSFLDDNLNRQYEKERVWRKILAWSSVLTIVIASMGLLGLALHAVNRRMKEIGIRKVLGASAASLVANLSKDFVKLMLLANLLGWPLAYLAAGKWLENFAYRIDLTVWVFLAAGALSLVIALLTISFRTLAAALSNPVDSLRYE